MLAGESFDMNAFLGNFVNLGKREAHRMLNPNRLIMPVVRTEMQNFDFILCTASRKGYVFELAFAFVAGFAMKISVKDPWDSG